MGNTPASGPVSASGLAEAPGAAPTPAAGTAPGAAPEPAAGTASGAAPDAASDPADGRIWTRRFTVLAGINLAIFFGFNVTTVGIPVYAAQLGAGDLVVGLITTALTAASLVTRPLAGYAIDRTGRRTALLAGLGIMFAVTIAFALFPLVGALLALRVIYGVGWGVGSTATSTIAADVIPRNRFAEGMGFFALSTSLAAAVAPAAGIALVQHAGAVAMIAVAAAGVGLALVCAFTQRWEEHPRAERLGRPRLGDLFDRRALLPSGIMGLVNMAFGSITTFIAICAESRGVDGIYWYFVVFAAVSIASRPLIGRVIDRKGFFLPAVLACVGVAATVATLAFARSVPVFCLGGVFAGLGVGTAMGTFQSMAVSRVEPQRRGMATATYMFGFDAGIGLGAAVAGVVAGWWGYQTMYLVMALFPLAALAAVCALGPRRLDGRNGG